MTEVSCSCGAVALMLHGAPIVSLVCYCDTCRDGSRRIEALPNAPAVREPDGGTAYVSYRKDRVVCVRGRELLEDLTLEPDSKTKRVIASCCNSALLIASYLRKNAAIMTRYIHELAAWPALRTVRSRVRKRALRRC